MAEIISKRHAEEDAELQKELLENKEEEGSENDEDK